MALQYATSRLNVLMQQIDDNSEENVRRVRQQEEAKFAPGATYQNWSKLGKCSPDTHIRPRNIDDVVKAVKRAVQLRQKVRVAGHGNSYNGCNYTDGGVMLHMRERMRKILSIDSDKMLLTCEAGANLDEICEALKLNHLQLPMMPSITNLTIGGVLASAAHGSGINTPSFCAALVAMTMVDGKGEIVNFHSGNEKDTEVLRLAACHLGLLGVCVQVTIKVEKRCVMRAHHNTIPLAKVPSVLAQRVTMNDFYRFWWVPHTDMCYECVVNKVLPSDEDGAAGGAAGGDGVSVSARSIQTTKTTASESMVRSKLQVIAKVMKRGVSDNEAHHADYKEFLLRQKSIRNVAMKLFRGNWLRHNVLEASLYAATYFPGALQPCINKTYQKIFLNHEEVAYGSPEELLTFDCLFPQHGIEWAIEAHRAIDALELVQAIVKNNNLKVHFPVEFRFSDADGCGISPANDRKTCWVGLVMFRPFYKDSPHTDKYYQLFAEGMERLGGRPHWSKFSPWTAKNYRQSYGKQWKRFMALRQQMDPDQTFVNTWAKMLLN